MISLSNAACFLAAISLMVASCFAEKLSVEDLSPLLTAIPDDTAAPAIGVVLIEDGELRGLGVAGVRKAGHQRKVSLDDKWHLGSCTKSMTATLAGVLVEEGKISWETTVSDVWGDELEILPDYESVTLGMLLANRGGVPQHLPNSVYAGIANGAKVTDLTHREIRKQRAKFAQAVLNLQPSHEPGTAYQYSNAGYVVAGAMLEQVTGKPWEKLIEERVFQPLEMAHSGFGNAARNDKDIPTQPWPHRDDAIPVAPGPGDDNSWVIGPAGTVHSSLADIARYLSMHATLETGPVLKKKETFQYLHRAVPANQNYARGWVVAERNWSQGPALTHDGSNTMNYCRIWVAPERIVAVGAFTNTAENGGEICRKAIELVVKKEFGSAARLGPQ